MSTLLASYQFPSGQRLEIVRGDLTLEAVDAVVNAANRYLSHGGGVAAAIVNRGGEVIQRESDAWVQAHGPVSHAGPAYTSAGKLPCRFVIHAVGPIMGEGDEDHKLSQAVTGSLQLAERLGLSSIAFPAISTGIYGYPKERAVPVFTGSFLAYFQQNPGSGLALVRMTLVDPQMIALFIDEIHKRQNQQGGEDER